jgi:hypothetical protein
MIILCRLPYLDLVCREGLTGVGAVAMMSSRLIVIGDSAEESLLVRPHYHGNS